MLREISYKLLEITTEVCRAKRSDRSLSEERKSHQVLQWKNRLEMVQLASRESKLQVSQQSRVPHATSSPKYPVSAHRGWMLLIVCLDLSVFPSRENIPRQNCSDALRPQSCSTRTPVSRLLTNTGRRRELSNHLPDRRGLLTSTIDRFHLPWRPARRVGINKLPAEQYPSSWTVTRASSSLANGAPASRA